MGCSNVNLYPLEGTHIIEVAKGETVIAPRDGYFLSDDYFKKILQAKVKAF